MCGIVGYAGKQQAAPLLLNCLSGLAYRGYDSAGVCVHGPDGMRTEKSKGRLEVLSEKIGGGTMLPGVIGIGHTRWATHGAPSDANSHPHLSHSGKIAVVHNGIVENEASLRRWLEDRQQTFRSQTDTEVVANLIGWHYEQSTDFMGAVQQTVKRLRGSYALGILCADHPDILIAVKNGSPLILGWGEGESLVSSDIAAVLPYTRTVSYLEDGDMAVVAADGVRLLDQTGAPVEREKQTVHWQVGSAQRDGYAHFMLKEIFEQPKAIRDTVVPRIKGGEVLSDVSLLTGEVLRRLRRIYLVACGSAYYVAMLGKYILERACGMPAEAVMASEFRYSDPVLGAQDLVVVISQSGETADSLAALREAKRRGAKTLAVVNVVGSAIAREADQVIHTWAGPEIAVATTKAFSAQLAVIQLLALHMAQQMKTVEMHAGDTWLRELQSLPDTVAEVLKSHIMQRCRQLATRFRDAGHVFYMGRGLDYAVALEGSLKMKEITYLPCEAYPAGELKHGPISMIEDGSVVVALATVDGLFDKTMANIREVKARGAEVICITLTGREADACLAADYVITVPAVHPLLQPGLTLLPMQLLAYYAAVERGCDVDKPRNLAKSVTVE